MHSDHGVTFRMAVGSWRGAARFSSAKRAISKLSDIFLRFVFADILILHISKPYDIVRYYDAKKKSELVSESEKFNGRKLKKLLIL